MVYATKTRILEALRQAQANTMCLYLNSKRYHWYSYGPMFRDLHLFFDEIAAVALRQVDPFAERARMLGGDPISTPEEIARAATIRISDLKGPMNDMLSEALENERRLVQEMKDAFRLADSENDPGSADLFAKAVQDHEKYAWFLEEALRKDDGLVV